MMMMMMMMEQFVETESAVDDEAGSIHNWGVAHCVFAGGDVELLVIVEVSKIVEWLADDFCPIVFPNQLWFGLFGQE